MLFFKCISCSVVLGGDYTIVDIEKIIDNEKSASVPLTAVTAEQNADNYISNFDNPPPIIKSGWWQVDKITGGFQKPSVVVVGARSSTGKTSFALNVALNTKVKSAFFSLEMSAGAIYDRIVACGCNLNYDNIIKRKLTEAQRQMALSFVSQSKSVISVYDNIYSIEQIGATIGETKPDIAVIDYVQNIQCKQEYGTTREKLNYVMAALREIASRSNCCIIALSQVTRAGKGKPTMSELMESGAIEANADLVMLLHRPYVVDKSSGASESQLQVLIDKNRFGATGTVEMEFIGATQTVREVDFRYASA